MAIPFYVFSGILAISLWYTAAAPSSDDVLLPQAPKPGATFRLQDPDAPECGTVDVLNSNYNAIKDPNKRWQNFYVKNDPNSDEEERDTVNDAMYQIMQHLPCLKFGIYKEDANPTGDYIQIVDEEACSSLIGKQGGEQTMSLGPGCYNVGTVMHEMLHALGLHHEQCRPDRDDFVDVHYDNIEPDKVRNFEKLSWDEWDTYGVPYEYLSIMHYGGTSFSKNGLPTITKKNGEVVGRERTLKPTDIEKLKKMYNC